MKYLLFVVVLGLLACHKEPLPLYNWQGKVFPTYVRVLHDTIVADYGSTVIIPVEAFQDMCGVAPEAESPDVGQSLTQLSGIPTANNGWTSDIPTVYNLVEGFTSWDLRVWVLGYRTCDGQTKTDDVHATQVIRTKANVQPTLSFMRQRNKFGLIWNVGPGEFEGIHYEVSDGLDTSKWSYTHDYDLPANGGVIPIRIRKNDPNYYRLVCTHLPYRDVFISPIISIP